MRLALYQPDIPQNTGTMLRTAACFGIAVDLIGPAGFDISDRALRRAGLDYLDRLELVRHISWDSFEQFRQSGPRTRLILLTSHGATSCWDFDFQPADIILMGRESAGVPKSVHQAVDGRLRIPLKAGFRSLNVAVAAGIVIGEAQRQLAGEAVLHPPSGSIGTAPLERP